MPKYLLIGQYVPGTVAPKPHRCPNRKLVSDGRHGPSPTIILLLNDESAHPALPTTTRHPSNIDASILNMVEENLLWAARPPLVAAKLEGEGGRFFCLAGDHIYWHPLREHEDMPHRPKSPTHSQRIGPGHRTQVATTEAQ